MNFIFDLDGTLTESKSLISQEMFEALKGLPSVTIISGASLEQMNRQIPNILSFGWTVMPQSGNVAYRTEKLWENRMGWKEQLAIFAHIAQINPRATDDQVEDRGCQISYSFTGHNADKQLKKSFDPDGRRRREVLEELPFAHRTVRVKVAGTTCLDYTTATKGDNLRRLGLEGEGVYIGDQLYEGGNDASVIGVMPTHAVTCPRDTLEYIKETWYNMNDKRNQPSLS